MLPAIFVEKQDDGRFVVDVLICKNVVERRIFDEYSLMGIENPKLVFIGIMTGVGFMQINFCNANKYEKMFKKKWNALFEKHNNDQ